MKSKDLSLSFKNEFKLYPLKFKDQSLDFKEYIWLLKKKSLTLKVQSLKVHEWSLWIHLCRVELVVQFPARGSTQVLLCLFPGVLWLWHFLYSVGPHPVSTSIYTLSLCRGHSRRVRLAKQETLTPPGHLVSPLVSRGPWMSTVVLYCWCHSDSASVLLYFTFLSHLFPLPCGAGSTVPREGFDSSVIMPFSWCVVAVTLPI